jgi:hypothetical protein
MLDIQRRTAQPDRSDDCEPVARWENEGGACGEREVAIRTAYEVRSAQDGQATARE